MAASLALAASHCCHAVGDKKFARATLVPHNLATLVYIGTRATLVPHLYHTRVYIGTRATQPPKTGFPRPPNLA